MPVFACRNHCWMISSGHFRSRSFPWGPARLWRAQSIGTKDPILFTVDGYRVAVMPMFVPWGDEAEAPTEPVAEVEAPTEDKPRRSRKTKEPVAVEV